MPCCECLQRLPFFNVATSTIPYTGQMPAVAVSYLQPDGSFLQNGVYTSVKITATTIEVDHGGGSESGVIIVMQ
jgi:hypothetical protein